MPITDNETDARQLHRLVVAILVMMKKQNKTVDEAAQFLFDQGYSFSGVHAVLTTSGLVTYDHGTESFRWS